MKTMATFLGRETWHDPRTPIVGRQSITGGDFCVPYSNRSPAFNGSVEVKGCNPGSWDDKCDVYIYLYHFGGDWRYILCNRNDASMDDIKKFGISTTEFDETIVDEGIYCQTLPNKHSVTYINGMQFAPRLNPALSYVIPLGTYIKKTYTNSHPVVIRLLP